MKFESIPEVVDAIQWLGDNAIQVGREMRASYRIDGSCLILNPGKNLEDIVILRDRDWVIKDRHGDIRTMSNLDFLAKYQLTRRDRF